MLQSNICGLSVWAMHAFDVMQVCAALWNWCINKDTFITNLGDWCLTSTGLQANAPSNKYNFVSRASDYMLTHFKLFSEVSCSTSLVDDVDCEASGVSLHFVAIRPVTHIGASCWLTSESGYLVISIGWLMVMKTVKQGLCQPVNLRCLSVQYHHLQ